MKNLRKLRKEKGFTQEVMADELDLAQSTYRQYEAGITEPKFSTLISIAEYFQVTVDYLIGRTHIRGPLSTVEQELARNLAELRNPAAKQAVLTILKSIREDS